MSSGSNRAIDAPKNELGGSTSPYLRQHANNPVAWQVWGPEALARARRENKPILLSVGYSACHWCHVMAHESFEDPEIASVMNEHFVSIKVDREERPDVDGIYQKAAQMMGSGGGWPLTVFLTPDQQPFYAGTYFPKVQSYGRPGFASLLTALHEVYTRKPDELQRQVANFMEGYRQFARSLDDGEVGPNPLSSEALPEAATRLLEAVDETAGGFGRAPKFPNPTALEVLARVGRGEDALGQRAAVALRRALDAMWRGGIYDHLRGGFARYSTDQAWLVPHFEKMLYDNAQLLGLYADASIRWPDESAFFDVVEQSIEYLAADMWSDAGTFFAAMDADSEGVEGRYYVWTPAELEDALGPDTARRFAAAYGVTERGNFEDGRSILHLARPLAEIAEGLDTPEPELRDALASARARLLERRYERVPPHRDDKVLTSWNALLVTGLCRAATAAEVARRPGLAQRWLALASGCARRLVDVHVQGVMDDDDGSGAVMRAEFEGRVHTRGYLDDVAFLARACLDLHELTLQPAWRQRAGQLAKHAIDQYARRDLDGFFFTARDGDPLLERTESLADGPIPSGTGVMLEVLLRLDASAVEVQGARAIAESIAARFATATTRPFAYASLLTGAAAGRADAVHVKVMGPAPDDARVVALARAVRAARPTLPEAVSLEFEPADVAAVVTCRGQTCSAPWTRVEDLLADLRG